MGTTTINPSKEQSYFHLTKKLLPYTIYAFVPIILFRLYFHPPPLPQSTSDELPNHITISPLPPPPPPPPSPPPPPQEKEKLVINETHCDYTNGNWVPQKLGPLYNGSTCGTIKDGQNCITHGRSDLGYLFWRWKPNQCNLPRFEPDTFLNLFANKHLAFVGDSMARNQLESLLCMLATVSPPNLVYTNGEDNKFRRWNFSSHNLTISVYWSPFLVDGVEKSNSGTNYNRLHLDRVNEKWTSEIRAFDMIVLSIGHWFLHPAVYFEGNSVLGCHVCTGLNHMEIGFYEVFRKAVRTALKTIIERRGGADSNSTGIDVIITTFSPHHFEAAWDDPNTCSKTRPFEEEEKKLEGMDAEMRKIEVEEVEKAKEDGRESVGLRIEALDVTKLSLLRPDGHPGPYMHPFPFANGPKDRVQNDCVHWCLPGPVDTWNEILLEVVKKWRGPIFRRL